MHTRKIGPFTVSAIGFGAMSLSHAYGAPPPKEEGARLLHAVLDQGYTFIDTAALYGFGANEKLIGETISSRRSEYMLASKCGIIRNAEGKREINGRPDLIRRTCEDSLKNLRTESIDLYYLHRWDKRVPVEESIGALADLVREGKIRTIGLSEVSADTIRRAHAVHPVSAVQSEYSLWTRNPEIGVLKTCAEIGAAFVAFGAVGRGFLAGGVRDASLLQKEDIRAGMPRFQGEAFAANLNLLAAFEALAHEAGMTPAQACLAWVLAQGDHIVPIPGTTKLSHAAENFAAGDMTLDPALVARMDALINRKTVAGPRYAPATQREIDTEEFAA